MIGHYRKRYTLYTRKDRAFETVLLVILIVVMLGLLVFSVWISW